METTVKKPSKELLDELTDLLLKKAGLRKEDVYETALRKWTALNLDLLSKSELKRYESITL